MSPAMAGRFLTTAPAGKSPSFTFTAAREAPCARNCAKPKRHLFSKLICGHHYCGRSHCPHCYWSILKHKFQKLLSGSFVSGHLLRWLVSMPFFSGLISYYSPSPSDHTSERCLALIFHDATLVNSHFLKS